MKKAAALLLVFGITMSPAPAGAHTLLSELILKVLLSDVVLAPPTGPFASHEAHFRPILRPGEVAPGFEINQLEIPLAINSIIASQLSSIPLGSSSGGFAYTFDPGLGTFQRKSSTFGSAFAERALTAGRGRWNAGVNFQRATYDTLEGKHLRGGDISVYLVHQDCCDPRNAAGAPPSPFFEGDVIANRLSLALTSSTFTAFLNYGITDRLDVGVTVPYVTTDMTVTVNADVLRLATADSPTIHSFDGLGSTAKTFSESSRARGIGDLLLRAKYRMFEAAGGGLAVGVDVRVPTGDSEQLLGTGGTQTRVSLIGSMAAGPFSPHVNLGYAVTAGGGQTGTLSVRPEPADEFVYTTGFDTAVTPRLTFSGDIIGRTLRDVGRLVAVPRQFPFTTRTGTFGTATFEEFTRRPGDLTLVVGAAGLRYNPRGNLLISAQVLLPITQAGLRDRITPVIGLDYSF